MMHRHEHESSWPWCIRPRCSRMIQRHDVAGMMHRHDSSGVMLRHESSWPGGDAQNNCIPSDKVGHNILGQNIYPKLYAKVNIQAWLSPESFVKEARDKNVHPSPFSFGKIIIKFKGDYLNEVYLMTPRPDQWSWKTNYPN